LEACEKDNLSSVISILSEHPCLLNARLNEHGFTALRTACENSHHSIVFYLVGQSGIDVNKTDKVNGRVI
jgi:hypothetical protein